MKQSKNNPHVYYWNGYEWNDPEKAAKINEEDLFLDTSPTQ